MVKSKKIEKKFDWGLEEVKNDIVRNSLSLYKFNLLINKYKNVLNNKDFKDDIHIEYDTEYYIQLVGYITLLFNLQYKDKDIKISKIC